MISKSQIESAIPVKKNFLDDVSSPGLNVEIVGFHEGFAIFFKVDRDSEWCVLHTHTGVIRYFVSPSSLFRFLANLGIKNASVKNINMFKSDAYTRQLDKSAASR